MRLPTSARRFSALLDFILRVCQSLRDSFLLLSYFYDPSMFIARWSSNFVEKGELERENGAKMSSRASYLVYVNLNRLSRNGEFRTTATTNCRVSFIDLYLFSISFKF